MDMKIKPHSDSGLHHIPYIIRKVGGEVIFEICAQEKPVQTGSGKGWIKVWNGLGLVSQRKSKIKGLGPRFKAFLSPGHCFLSFQALWLYNCLNIFRHEREIP
jgi:hypothetical protein